MVYILHGADTDSSYLKLRSIVSAHKELTKITLGKDSDQILPTLAAQDLFETGRVIIAENLISAKKIKAQDIKNLPDTTILVLREDQSLTPATLKAFTPFAHIEEFKLPSTLYYFLDSILPNSKNAISQFVKLQKQGGIAWQLQNRLLLLILIKLNLNQIEVSEITGKSLADWQWQKLANQARAFDLVNLKAMFSGALKVETLSKTGETQTPQSTLLSLMLTKYLRVS